MNKIKSILIVVVILFSANINAEDVIGTYTSNYFNKSYDIEASEIKNGKFSIYIQVSAERESTKAMISIDSDKLELFRQSLIQTKEKFVEWSKVAKENNVTDMLKDMGIKYPSATICWLSSKWHFSFGQKLTPKFLILDNNKHVISFCEKVTASDNKYIDETIYWVFSDPKEIDDLLSVLDYNIIKQKLEKKENAAELFK